MILGVDPGFTGAIVGLKKDNSLIVADLPVLKYKGRKQIDTIHFKTYIEGLKSLSKIRYAVIEEIGAMPGQACPLP